MELENVKQEELQLELEHHKKSTLRTSYKSTDFALNSPAESTTSSVELSKLTLYAIDKLDNLVKKNLDILRIMFRLGHLDRLLNRRAVFYKYTKLERNN